MGSYYFFIDVVERSDTNVADHEELSKTENDGKFVFLLLAARNVRKFSIVVFITLWSC